MESVLAPCSGRRCSWVFVGTALRGLVSVALSGQDVTSGTVGFDHPFRDRVRRGRKDRAGTSVCFLHRPKPR